MMDRSMSGPSDQYVHAFPTAELLAWHEPAKRGLPWRERADPYGILVSEIMSQQTQAGRVAAAWTSFMSRFPTFEALATAPVGEVIDAWQGLGYNRRAVNLHRCAQRVVADHDGQLPSDRAALLALPGIGPYTAAAVMGFAFGHDVIAVDTNVARILARVHDHVLSAVLARNYAEVLTGTGKGPALTAALMDLGARICTARSPSCEKCPLALRCGWRGGPGQDPAARGAHRPRPQGRFEGSLRQARGRVVQALRTRPISRKVALELAGEHGEDLLSCLVADGLAQRRGETFALPGWSGQATSHDTNPDPSGSPAVRNDSS